MNATMATFFCTKSFIQTIILTKYPLHKHKTMSLVLIFCCFFFMFFRIIFTFLNVKQKPHEF